MERARYFQFQKDSNYSVLTIHINEEVSNIKDEGEFKKVINKMSYLIDMICQKEDQIYLIANMDNNIQVLLMWEDVKHYNNTIQQIMGGVRLNLHQADKLVCYTDSSGNFDVTVSVEEFFDPVR